MPFLSFAMVMAVTMSVSIFSVRMWLDGVWNKMKKSIT